MKNDNDYISAITTEPVRIMGVKLRPFSIGHYLLMKKYECNFVAEGPEKVTLNDIILGISICARTFDEFIEFVNEPKSLKWIEKWGKAVNKELKKTPDYFIEKQTMFENYLSRGMRSPKYWLMVEQDRPSNSGKFIEHVITTLQGKLGYTREEVLNVPFTQAIYDYMLYLEQNGIIQLMSDDDLKLLEASDGK